MIRLGEKPFLSVQGEGNRTGVLSIWIRFFGCNLQCRGFMQKYPTLPETHVFTPVDFTKIKRMEDLPVFETGCDSMYSWDPKYKKLAYTYETPKDLMDEINKLLYLPNEWHHPVSQNVIDICFTGGEPMMQQLKILDIIKESNFKGVVEIESNGTQLLKEEFSSFWTTLGGMGRRVNFNVSPKLYYVSGEQSENAWFPERIVSYFNISRADGCLKFVMNNDDRAWAELGKKVRELRDLGLTIPVYVMPVGATKEQQEDMSEVTRIAKRALAEGYHISGRLHAILFGNTVGV